MKLFRWTDLAEAGVRQQQGDAPREYDGGCDHRYRDGATVVLAQFGQMESFGGKSKLPEFVTAYEKLIDQISAKDRRVVLMSPRA